MAKPYIEKSRKTFINKSSESLVVGSQQKSQEPDLFYEIEPSEVLFVLNKVSDLETFQLLNDDGQPDKSLLNS